MSVALPVRYFGKAAAWLSRRVALSFIAAGIADWLFYNQSPIGLSLPLFMIVCAAMVISSNPVRARASTRIKLTAILAVCILALVEDVSWLSLIVAIPAMLLWALAMCFGRPAHWSARIFRAAALPFVGIAQLIGDAVRVRRLTLRGRQINGRFASFATWIVPVLLSAVFVSLFASANPLIDGWMKWLDPRWLLDQLSVPRLLFWLFVVCLVWPLVHLRRARKTTTATLLGLPPINADLDVLFGESAVMRSLIIFNLLFALQTAMDIAYLWGGLGLPDGLSYAAYSHRGAYPLIVTALLAAGFVLLAMRPGGPAKSSTWIVRLVLVWVAQNVLLVLSSIFRTSLYVAAYSLSGLRLAALIWMGLVAIGLVLIVVKIICGKSNRWLLDANVLAGTVTLIVCCFVNVPYVVARYNVAHSAELGGGGPRLDVRYLLSLGPHALPALDDADLSLKFDRQLFELLACYRERRQAAVSQLRSTDWRSWSLRDWRLKRYFEPRASSASPPLDAANG